MTKIKNEKVYKKDINIPLLKTFLSCLIIAATIPGEILSHKLWNKTTLPTYYK